MILQFCRAAMAAPPWVCVQRPQPVFFLLGCVATGPILVIVGVCSVAPACIISALWWLCGHWTSPCGVCVQSPQPASFPHYSCVATGPTLVGVCPVAPACIISALQCCVAARPTLVGCVFSWPQPASFQHCSAVWPLDQPLWRVCSVGPSLHHFPNEPCGP